MNVSEFALLSPLNHAASDVFDWHMRPGALERLIPPWEHIKIERRTGTPADGGHIRFKLSRGPTELTWEVKHTNYEEGRLFSDEQTRGPFTRWLHTHRFEVVGEGRSTVEDHVSWKVPMGMAGKLLGDSTVEHELERLHLSAPSSRERFGAHRSLWRSDATPSRRHGIERTHRAGALPHPHHRRPRRRPLGSQT